MRDRNYKGFTLIELVITMTVGSIIALVTSQLISRPVTAYANLSLRAQLVDSAESSLERMTREIRSALPNSIRINTTNNSIEFLRTIDGGRYRLHPTDDLVSSGNVLSFDPSIDDNSDGFEVLGPLSNPGGIATSSDAGDCITGNADCLVIFNTGQINNNAYQLDNVATITGVSGTPSIITFAFQGTQEAFPTSSLMQRFSIIDTPISFICDTTADTIRRYENYPITASHANVDQASELTSLGANNALVADKIDECSFEYNSGSATRSGLVTIRLKLSETMPSGHVESVTLVQQIHVKNTP